MDLLQRFPLLLFQPDYATSDLYDHPPIIDPFIVVCLYAFFSGVKTFISVLVASESIKFGIFTFIGSLALVFFTWVLLTFFFYFVSDILGATGELHNTISFVGFAAVPNVIVSVLSLLILIVELIFFSGQQVYELRAADFGLSIIGMAWGWPGILCYFGLKNAQGLGSVKALLLVLPVFFGFVLLEILTSSFLNL